MFCKQRYVYSVSSIAIDNNILIFWRRYVVIF